MSKQCILYGTLDCHLCDEAQELLALFFAKQVQLKNFDIMDDEELYQRYEVRIPVLQRCDNESELCWPFTKDDVTRFLSLK